MPCRQTLPQNPFLRAGLPAADNMLLVREAISAIAARHGLTATFLPKPFPECVGSGAHLHISMKAKGENLMSHLLTGLPTEEGSLAESFLAGELPHAQAPPDERGLSHVPCSLSRVQDCQATLSFRTCCFKLPAQVCVPAQGFWSTCPPCTCSLLHPPSAMNASLQAHGQAPSSENGAFTLCVLCSIATQSNTRACSVWQGVGHQQQGNAAEALSWNGGIICKCGGVSVLSHLIAPLNALSLACCSQREVIPKPVNCVSACTQVKSVDNTSNPYIAVNAVITAGLQVSLPALRFAICWGALVNTHSGYFCRVWRQ